MRLYIKSDFTKKIDFTTRELVWKMWFKERNGKKISYSNVGDDAMLQDDFYFGVRLHKWSSVDERWDKAPFIIPSNPWLSLEYESITLEFEKTFITEWRERGDYLRIATSHIDVLTVDKRALYIMATEVASAIDGQISEDDKESWLSVEEFKKRHEDILSMSYEQANEMSLEEIPFMDDVRDPVWEEDDRRNEEYIKIYGEVELDEEEDE